MKEKKWYTQFCAFHCQKSLTYITSFVVNSLLLKLFLFTQLKNTNHVIYLTQLRYILLTAASV